ncbi:MAG TPA: oligosaccharide flippase family protein [Chloroflexaceae bacterium]|nr:oligosaccharide flippase family protein [Chloroflexaceae bacterium]
MGAFRQLPALLTGKASVEFLAFSGSLLALQGSRFVVSVIAAADLGAATYGYWNILSLVLLYGLYLQLGVLNGMGRDVPYYIGRGDAQRNEHILAVSWSVALVSGVVGAALTLAASFWYAEVRTALQLLGMTLVAQVLFQYFQFRLRAELRFAEMGWLQFATAVALPLWYFLARPWGLAGFVAAQGLATASGVFLAARLVGFRPLFVLDRVETARLVRVGFPIMAAGILFSLLTTVDRWVILGFLGVEQLGYYTLSILCLSLIGLFPQMVTSQMYPRLARRYGETNSVPALRRPLLLQGLLAFGITLPVVIVTYLSLPLLTTHLLPQYTQGVAPARLVLLGMLSLPISGTIGNFLNVIGRQWWFMLVQLGGICVQLLAGVLFVQWGWGLGGVALAAVVTYAATTAALVGMVYRLSGETGPAPGSAGAA